MSRNTKIQFGYGFILIIFMVIQYFGIFELDSNHRDYSEKRIAFLQQDLSKNGFSSEQVGSISSAVRDTDFMLSSRITSVANQLIFFNTMGLIMAMTFFSALIKKKEKDD